MDYLYAKFYDFSFSRFGFIVWTDRQTDRHTESQNHRCDDCYTHATTVGMSNNAAKFELEPSANSN